jgi:hypothetical protein
LGVDSIARGVSSVALEARMIAGRHGPSATSWVGATAFAPGTLVHGSFDGTTGAGFAAGGRLSRMSSAGAVVGATSGASGTTGPAGFGKSGVGAFRFCSGGKIGVGGANIGAEGGGASGFAGGGSGCAGTGTLAAGQSAALDAAVAPIGNGFTAP